MRAELSSTPENDPRGQRPSRGHAAGRPTIGGARKETALKDAQALSGGTETQPRGAVPPIGRVGPIAPLSPHDGLKGGRAGKGFSAPIGGGSPIGPIRLPLDHKESPFGKGSVDTLCKGPSQERVHGTPAPAAAGLLEELEGLDYERRPFRVVRVSSDGRASLETLHFRVPATLCAEADDLAFVERHLRPFPKAWRTAIARRYTSLYRAETGGRRKANTWLREIAQIATRTPLALTADEDAIRAKAEARARSLQDATPAVCRIVIQASGLPVPDHYSDAGLVARCRDKQWWRRQLRKGTTRAAEDIGREISLVHKRAGLYITDQGVRTRQQQSARNAETLAGLVAENEDGESFDLDELVEASIANPQNRRAELMLRMHDFEALADKLGHVGEFWTLTVPSRFHAVHSRSCQLNERFDGATVREGQEQLRRVWARIRARLNREGIRPYGFRVAEPHHDGTPHWHLLVFLPQDDIERARAIVRHYALEDAPDEPGAAERRCTFKRIEKSKGTATGYIAKYIAKNIDGFALAATDPAAPDEAQGRDPQHLAERVGAWAATHGIRQFQQVGGPPVSVWREARRLHAEQSGVLEEVRQRAHSNDWAGFVEAMGGPNAPRQELPVRVARMEWWMTDTGGLDTNRYGEPAPSKVFGLDADGLTVATRKRWDVYPKRSDATAAPATSNTPTSASTASDDSLMGPFSPWSSVNNCTYGPEPPLTSGGASRHEPPFPSDVQGYMHRRGGPRT